MTRRGGCCITGPGRREPRAAELAKISARFGDATTARADDRDRRDRYRRRRWRDRSQHGVGDGRRETEAARMAEAALVRVSGVAARAGVLAGPEVARRRREVVGAQRGDLRLRDGGTAEGSRRGSRRRRSRCCRSDFGCRGRSGDASSLGAQRHAAVTAVSDALGVVAPAVCADHRGAITPCAIETVKY